VTRQDEERLATLIPALRARVRWLIATAAKYGADIAVVSAGRTAAEQARLYEQGRTRPGAVVTWTRASQHIGGQAVDLAFRVRGSVSYAVPRWWWDALAWIGTQVGLRRPAAHMGDLGHFEL